MIEQVFPDIFRIEIPLPDNPLKATNSYIVKGNERHLIIDTGMNRGECRQAMDNGLKELSIDLLKTDFFITHVHVDHFGLVYELASKTSKIYFNGPDTRIVNDPKLVDKMMELAATNGFPADELRIAIQEQPGWKYQSRDSVNLTLMREGEEVSIGEYVFQCIETPGHTPGHLCLYEPMKKIIFSGDHLLEEITPNITTWHICNDSLQQYLDSLDKIDRFAINCVLPGHRRIFYNHHKRIAELKHHHETRINEIFLILKSHRQNAYQIASQMTWDIDCGKWEKFPILQKWFATGEALSHLNHLHNRGEAKKEIANGNIFFSLNRGF